MSDYPLIMNRLTYQWKSEKYTATFKSYSAGSGYVEIGQTSLIMGGKASLADNLKPSESLPSGWGTFVGYYYFENADETAGQIGNSNKYGGQYGVQYFNNKLTATRDWDKTEEVTLYAVYGKSYSVTLHPNGGEGSNIAVEGLVCGSEMPSVIHHIRTGYTFTGYFTEKDLTKQSKDNKYYNADMSSYRDWDMENNTTVLYAGWNINQYKVTTSVSGKSSITVTKDNGMTTVNSGDKVDYGTVLHIKITHGDINHSSKLIYNNNTYHEGDTDYNFTMVAYDINIYASSENKCVTPGTLITLADGSQKPVEQLKDDEMLLVWNIYTGQFDAAPILFIDSDPETVYEIINLYFSDGSTLKVISEHGFWDYNLNAWVFLRNDAAKYIGHWFNKYVDSSGELSNAKVQLIDVAITEELTTAWSPVTFGHLCYYVNGILSMPGATEGLINIFDVNPETMKVDEEKMAADIEKYGLFTYEDFADYIPEEVFYAFNGQYLKVAMGKGLLTWDDIYALIDRYQEFWQTLN